MRIDNGDIHLWQASLAPGAEALAGLRSMLSPEERARAGRFAFDPHRDRFTVMGAARRAILAKYTAQRPENIRFVAGAAGKPALSGPNARRVEFNDSRSGDLALFAVARGRRVGVDLEQVRGIPECDRIVRSFGSAREWQSWTTVPPRLRHIAFFRWWTLKEAYVKALGDGLSLPLDHFTVSFRPGTRAAILEPLEHGTAGRGWDVVVLEPAPGFVGAVVAEGPIKSLQRQTWQAHTSASD